VVMVLTEWEQFVALDPNDLAQVVRRRTVIDGRNCLAPAMWRDANWVYRGMGRP
jgi:UDPglucose 6-dehydrogenase